MDVPTPGRRETGFGEGVGVVRTTGPGVHRKSGHRTTTPGLVPRGSLRRRRILCRPLSVTVDSRSEPGPWEGWTGVRGGLGLCPLEIHGPSFTTEPRW